MLWRNFEDRKRKWWREKCTQRAVRFEWSWKEKKRRERDEMLTRTLAQWIFQRVKTLKPVSNIPASIFVLYPWRNFRSRRVRFFNRKLERNRDVRRGVTSHAPKIRDETDSRERVRERERERGGREREREKPFEKRFHFILALFYRRVLLLLCPDFRWYSLTEALRTRILIYNCVIRNG